MKYVILLTLLILVRLDNVETPEEASKLGEHQEAKVSLDEQSKY